MDLLIRLHQNFFVSRRKLKFVEVAGRLEVQVEGNGGIMLNIVKGELYYDN